MLKTTQSAKNLSLSIAGNAEVGSIGGRGECEDETIERSSLTSKNLNGATGYLILKARLAFI